MIYQQEDTIAAISTPPCEGGIAVIRMSGHEAIKIAKKAFRGNDDIFKSESHRVHHGWIFENNEPIDEVVMTIFRAPNSYTGEDVIEISCHGGVYLSRRILELIIDKGARPAQPGEFTQRGFLHGKMDLSQAEAVADLVRAKTEASRRVAIYQLEGRLSECLEKMRESLVEACSIIEIELDFSEEDIEFASKKELIEMLVSMRVEIKKLLESFNRGKVCRDGIRMVIVGRPNVGKSSILNSLVERERAIVTEVPGTTRDTIEDILDIEGLLFIITDTAGIRKTKDPVENEGVKRAEKALDESDLVLLIFDGSEFLNSEDEMIVNRILKRKKKKIVVVNKIDLNRRIEINKLEKWMKDTKFLMVSALTRKGIPELIKYIEQTVLEDGIPQEGEVVLNRVRHRDAISRAEERIKQAEISLKKGMSQEFVAIDLRGALEAIGEITGQTTTDDILNRIFSEFCIGK
jgi:tRNA modification GTPase